MTTTVLETLVGEGKKFQTAEQLAESKLAADQYIEKLKADLVSLQAQVANGTSVNSEALEKILSEIKNKETVTTTDTSSNSSNQSGQGLTEEAIVKILEKREAAKTAERNWDSVMSAVKSVYGSKSDEYLTKLAQETGQTVDELKAFASRSPQGFLRLSGLNGNAQSGNQSSAGTVNSQALASTSNEDGTVRNKAYYDSKMKEMGAKKFAFDSGLQIQMHLDMARLGDSWYS